ncbi:MAG: sulfite exporter TauE/SafE family protein [Sandaracinaceae bacterium]|nr:sulfite exporter TauE/SafE family protein [Sandaracinaceae bacterium]
MTIEPELLAFALIVFCAYAVQTVIGFGSTVLAVTLGAHLFEIRELLALEVPISVLQTSYVALRHRAWIDGDLLFKRVLPLMAAGTVAGFLLFAGVSASWLRVVLGASILILSARELWAMRPSAAHVARPPLPRPVSIAAILGAGIFHGVFATGGPLLVYAIGREGLDKHRFRATLAVVWLTLGLILVTSFALDGRYAPATGLRLLVLLPAVPLGIVVGEWLHHRVDERRFRVAVWGLLLAAAVTLIVR